MLRTGADWTTGVYLIRMTEALNGMQSYAIFVLRNDHKNEQADIVFQLPVNTYQAYNYWGGKSLYSTNGQDSIPWGYHAGKPGAVKVSFNRPFAASNNKQAAYGNGAGEFLTNMQPIHKYPISSSAGWNYNMVRWLERNHVNVAYITNIDVHTRLPTMLKPKLLLTQGHCEYWTWAMRQHVASWRDQGVHLAFLGSNTAFWQVRYEDIDGTDDNAEPRTLVCYRRIRRESDHSQFRTVKWRAVWPEALLVGVEYIGDPFDEAMIVANSSHWAFDGTGISNGNAIPGLLGYEVDGINRARMIPQNSSRDEVIHLTTLFETPVVDRQNKPLLCHGTIYRARSGANVFASGTMQWSWGLDDYNVQQGLRTSRLSHVVERVTQNILAAAGVSLCPGASEQAPSVSAKVAADYQPSMKMVAFTDFEFLPLAKHWYKTMTRLGYREHVIVAIDQLAFDALSGTKHRVELEHLDAEYHTSKPRYVRNLWSHRITYCLKQIEQGVSILLTDADNVFARYVPLTDFQMSGYDVLHAYEMRFPVNVFKQQGFVLCGGMTWFTANKQSEEFLRLVSTSCGDKPLCNDQKVVNTLYLRSLAMDWLETPSTHGPTAQRVVSNDSNKGLLEVGMVGRSNVTGHAVKIWDRDFAWRGPFDTQACPSTGNWVAMPGAVPYHLIKNRDLTRVEEKLVRMFAWDSFCGLNGTNRGNASTIMWADRMRHAVDAAVLAVLNMKAQTNEADVEV